MTSALKTRVAALWTRLRSIRRDRSGNFGVITSLLIVPLVGMAGLSVDFLNTLEVRERVRQVADSIVLDAVSTSNRLRYQDSNADFAALNAELQRKAENAFLTAKKGSQLQGVDVAVEASAEWVDKQIRFTVRYAVNVPTSLLRVVGFDSFPFNGEAKGNSRTIVYKQLHILVDNSPSMGLAANAAAVEKMRKATDIPEISANARRCEFACHVPASPGVVDTYLLAKSQNIPLRIDIVKDALNQFITNLSDASNLPNQFKIALYNLGTTSTSSLQGYVHKTSDMTSDYKSLIQSNNSTEMMMDLGVREYFKITTPLPEAITSMDREIPENGDGLKPETPEQMFILLTDGLVNNGQSYKHCWGFTEPATWTYPRARCLGALRPSYCDTLKARGVKVVVIYTTFLPMPGDTTFKTAIAPFYPNIKSGLQQCASDGLFFEAGYGDPMKPVMDQIFDRVTGGSRLTN